MAGQLLFNYTFVGYLNPAQESNMFVRIAFLAFTFGCLFLAQMGRAEVWKRIALTTHESVQIELNYQITQSPASDCIVCARYYYAKPLWISVEHPLLGKGDKVRVVLLNFKRWSIDKTEKLVVGEFDLEYDGDNRFIKQLPGLSVYSDGPYGQETYRQELAVVINGKWLKNNMDKTSNFGFKLK
jgi:hypothetical protein